MAPHITHTHTDLVGTHTHRLVGVSPLGNMTQKTRYYRYAMPGDIAWRNDVIAVESGSNNLSCLHQGNRGLQSQVSQEDSIQNRIVTRYDPDCVGGFIFYPSGCHME